MLQDRAIVSPKAGSATFADAETLTSPGTAAALTTMGRTISIGPDGAGGYRQLTSGPGEPHIVRADIVDASFANVTYALTAFAQMTDLHIVDDQSPLRVEFLDRYANPGPPHEGSYPTSAAYRAHECMSTQVVDAMCRAIAQVGHGPRTGLPLNFTIVTGDAVDNCQWNEVRWYVDLLDGGNIVPNSGGSSDHSVTGDALGLDINYWHPSNKQFELSNKRGPGLDLNFQAGFPEVLALPGGARIPFSAHGLQMPWFSAYGNHDALVQGNVPTDLDLFGLSVQDAAVGTFKRSGVADPVPDKFTGSFDDYVALAKLAIFQTFSGVLVPADANRRLLTRSQFIGEHFNTAGAPGGHGFSSGTDRAYYVMPFFAEDLIRHIVLDTTNPAGGASGLLDDTQWQWLQQLLLANSSRYLNPDSTIATQPGVEDKLFIIYSHHTLSTMSNTFRVDNPHSGAELQDLLLRFPNVILHVNGHNHKNHITPHQRAGGNYHVLPGGFWEVTTASHIDWPYQSRLFDIASGRGTISIFTTMVDIDAPLDYRSADINEPATLASLSRELAANDLQQRASGTVSRPGTPADRNTQLLVPAPFALPDPHVYGSPITIARDLDGRLELFGTDGADRIFRRSETTPGGAFPEPLQFDGQLRCVAAETNLDGRVELFGIDAAGTPFHRRQLSAGSDTWSPWVQLPGQLTSIAVTRNLDGRLAVFGTNLADEIFSSVQTAPGADTLTNWNALDGLVTQIAAETNADGRIVLFGVNAAGRAYQRSQSAPGVDVWSSWEQIIGPLITPQYWGSSLETIAAARNDDGGIDIFGTTQDGEILHSRQSIPGNTSALTAWQKLDDATNWAQFNMRQSAVERNAAGRLQLFAVDADGRVFERTLTASAGQLIWEDTWSDWVQMSGALRPTMLPNTAPHAASPGDQTTPLGAAVNLDLARGGGGVAPMHWTVSGLPAGLTCDADGRITGAPVPTGVPTSSLTATLTDANFLTSSIAFNWTVVAVIPNVLSDARASAENAITAAGLTVGQISSDTRCIDVAGTVLTQSPLPDAVVPQGTSVHLTVSTGTDQHGRKCVFE